MQRNLTISKSLIDLESTLDAMNVFHAAFKEKNQNIKKFKQKKKKKNYVSHDFFSSFPYI